MLLLHYQQASANMPPLTLHEPRASWTNERTHCFHKHCSSCSQYNSCRRLWPNPQLSCTNLPHPAPGSGVGDTEPRHAVHNDSLILRRLGARIDLIASFPSNYHTGCRSCCCWTRSFSRCLVGPNILAQLTCSLRFFSLHVHWSWSAAVLAPR